jgi:secreted trypsin-like serine protease
VRRLVPVVAALFLLLPAGAAAQFQPRVVNGSPAAAGDLPWTVAVQTAGRTAFDGHFCGGTLVAPDRVLTAAHCVLATGPDEIEVFAGSADLAHKRPPRRTTRSSGSPCIRRPTRRASPRAATWRCWA